MNFVELFGGDPKAPYWLTRWLLQRSLAGIYLVAFLVAANQFRALLGTRGLTPAPYFLANVSFSQSPSVFFLHYSDAFASALSWVGVGLAALALTGVSERFGTPVSMVVWFSMWLLYLSFVNVGQTWYSFGWESLLLEAGFLAIFLGARDVAPPAIVIWMYRWLVFRLMFGAGMIKLRGDPCWRDLTCLVYHYQSQPIPNPLSWYFHRLPLVIHKAGVLFNHFAELIAPFGALLPQPLRVVRIGAGLVIVAFQFMLILSGNLSWLNWLTIVVAISCFDDGFLARILPVHPATVEPAALPHQVALGLLTLLVVALSIRPALNLVSRQQMMNASFEPLHLVNTYGAFGSVSRDRFEVIMEGTADSVPTAASTWKEYEFRAKPGDVSRGAPIVAPYHLRLDWLMWFAALSQSFASPWFAPLAARLLQNDRATLSLMSRNPFPDAPPRWVRARLYQYWFTSSEERRKTGNRWRRELVGEYMRPISLATPGLIESLEAQGWVR